MNRKREHSTSHQHSPPTHTAPTSAPTSNTNTRGTRNTSHRAPHYHLLVALRIRAEGEGRLEGSLPLILFFLIFFFGGQDCTRTEEARGGHMTCTCRPFRFSFNTFDLRHEFSTGTKCACMHVDKTDRTATNDSFRFLSKERRIRTTSLVSEVLSKDSQENGFAPRSRLDRSISVTNR